jgi:UDP-N-acetylglucosamine pyrophosphorylase
MCKSKSSQSFLKLKTKLKLSRIRLQILQIGNPAVDGGRGLGLMVGLMDKFTPFRTKMESDGLSAAAIKAFEHSFRALERNETGMILESSIDPVHRLPNFSELPAIEENEFQELLKKTAVIKLNGGLGTGMGLEKAKSLLPVREGMSFLDLIAKQILHLREKTGGSAPKFLLMNSFSTSEDTKAALAKHSALGDPAKLEMMQSRVPKVDASTLEPAVWEKNPSQEWCPPGHGDIYPSLLGSGVLDALLAEGIIYAFVSNSDNLGADLDPKLLSWFAKSGAPFAMEVTRRTPVDSKGGHLARRSADERLILRESAQCAAADAAAFEDIHRHQFFNTNNLWIRLDHLKFALDANGGLILLPMIRNQKTIDPRDESSPKVYQLETAMGAAIECFPGAVAIEVPRLRFAPVKTTSDLMIIRSNACVLTEDFRIELHHDRHGQPPVLELDKAHYKLVDGLETLISQGVPELLHCKRLKVHGKMSFSPGVVVEGQVSFETHNPAGSVVPPGTYHGGHHHV